MLDGEAAGAAGRRDLGAGGAEAWASPAGQRMLLEPSGALFWPERRILVVSDLHLEKGSASASRGSLVPPWDTSRTLDALEASVAARSPAAVVALGDSFHDGGGPGRMLPRDAERLLRLARAFRFVWVAGNHDPAPAGFPGEPVPEWIAGALTFRHAAAPGARGEVCGHFHPKATVATRGGRVTRACFVADGDRVMLPAMGAYAGGLDVRDPAVAGLFPGGARVSLLGDGRVFGFDLGPGLGAAAGGTRRAR